MKPIKTKSGLETTTKKGYEQLLNIANKIKQRLINKDLTTQNEFFTKIFYPLSKTASNEYNQEIWNMLPPETPLCQTMYETYAKVKTELLNYIYLLKK